MGDRAHIRQKKKVVSFPQYADLPIDDTDYSDDYEEDDDDRVANIYQFIPPEVFPECISGNEKTRQLKVIIIYQCE